MARESDRGLSGEAVTLLSGGEVPDSVYVEVCRRFSAKEIAGLSFAVAEMNA